MSSSVENSIKVSNLVNGTNWEKRLSDEEAGQVKEILKGKESVNPFKACIIPVRSHNLNDFAKDFFLPTTLNYAIKVQHTVGKVFAILGALFLDFFTFPIRLITCIPRFISNRNQKPIAFHQYLIDQRVDPKLLEDNWVRVRLSWSKTTPGHSAEDGRIIYDPSRNGSIKKNINFIEFPYNRVNDSSYSSEKHSESEGSYSF